MKNHPDHVKNSQIPPATSGLAWDEIRYVYDPLGRRLAKTVTENGAFKRATRFIYDGWNVVEERTERQGAPGISKFLFWGEDLSGSMQGAGGVGGLLTQMEKTDTTNWSASYYHYDGNGNVATVSGPFRAVIAKFSYDGFGRTVTQTGAKSGIDINAIPYRFSTKPMELELATANTTLVPPPVSSGLYYYGYRFYSPNLGRWISRDPIREKGGRNLYNFVGNDGVDKMDKLGLEDACCQGKKYNPEKECCENGVIVKKIGQSNYKCCPVEYEKQAKERSLEIERYHNNVKGRIPYHKVDRKFIDYLNSKFPCTSTEDFLKKTEVIELEEEFSIYMYEELKDKLPLPKKIKRFL